MAQRKRLRIWCRCWSLVLAFTQHFDQVAGQSVEAQPVLCTNAATLPYLRWVPFWTRALEMGSFDGCAASELVITGSDWTERSLRLSEASGLGPFEQGCGPVVLTIDPPMPMCGYRFRTANVSDLRDPVSFALHGSADGLNWLILDEESDYNTSTSRMARSHLFDTDLRNISVEVPVQIIVFSIYAARGWTHAGHIPADLYAIHELQLMVGGEVLDLYEAVVETGPDFFVGSWGTSTSTSMSATSRSTTSTTGSNTTRTTTSTTVSLSSMTTSSSTASRTSMTATSMTVTSTTVTSTAVTTTTTSTISHTRSTTSSLSYTSSSSITGTSSTTTTTSITSTRTSTTVVTSTMTWTTRTWTTRTTYSTFTWWSSQTWTWTTTTRTTITTTTITTQSSTSTSSSSLTSTSTSFTTSSTRSTTTSTSTVSTTTSRSVSITSTSTDTTMTLTTQTLTGTTLTTTLSTMTTFTSTTRTTFTATFTSSTTTTGTSTSISTTSSSTWRNSSINGSYLRVDLSSPVMLQAFRYITSQQSIDRDPVQFALWGSSDNGSSWMPLFFQNETTAVPTTRGAPTAWYVMTTTTTTTLSQDDAVKDALGNLESSKLAFLSLLDGLNMSGNGVLGQRVEVQADGVVLMGVAMAASENGEPVAFGYGDVTVEVPSAILEGLGVPAVAVLGLVPSSSGLFNLLNSTDGADGGLQSDILSLDLFADGNAVKDLVQPIQMTMSSTPEQPTGCAFLDESLNEWSNAGLSRVSLDNGTLVCATNHLSIFAAILDSAFAALACSNAAAIFSAKGFQSLGSRLWIFETAAVLNWLTLLSGLVLIFRARKEDNKYQAALEQINVIRSLSLKQRHKDHTVKAGDRHNGEHDDHDEHMTMKAAFLEEFHHFIEGGLIRMAYSRMLRAKIGLTLKDLKKMYDQSGHSSVHTTAEQFLKEFEERRLARRLSFWYRMNCIWFSVLQPSAASSSLVRTAVLLGKIYSGWAVSAVFYGATSIAPGEEAGCTPPEGAFDVFIRSLTVQLISSGFGALPFAALVLFFYKLKWIRLSIRRAIFWSFLGSYFLFCIMVISIFIASVSQVDANKWFYTSLIDLILTWFVPIMLLAALAVLLSVYWMRGEEHHKTGHHQALHPVLPWPAFGVLQTYEVKLGSLEVSEKMTRKKKPFIVTCEIGGCPETSKTFERIHGDDAYRVSHGVYHIAENQVLLFSVHHRKGKMPPQLRGRAFIPASDFLEDGLNGKLPLKLNGRSAQMEVQVFFHKPKRPEVPVVALASLPSDIYFKLTEDTDAMPSSAEEKVAVAVREAAIEKTVEEKPEEEPVLIQVEEEEEAELLEAEPVEPEEQRAPEEREVSVELRTMVDLEEDGEPVPSEPPPLCARGTRLALTHTVKESNDELVTVDVDTLSTIVPPTTMAEEPEQSGFATALLVPPQEGNTPSAFDKMDDEPVQQAKFERESDQLSVPSISRSSRTSTSPPPRKRSPGPTREEVLQKVSDSKLRDLCSIAEQRRFEPLPSARGSAT